MKVVATSLKAPIFTLEHLKVTLWETQFLVAPVNTPVRFSGVERFTNIFCVYSIYCSIVYT